MSSKIRWGSRLASWLNNRMQPWQVALLIAAVGIVIFWTGLSGDFQGDDQFQIVDNVAVHSLQNIGAYFTGGTFWNGEALVGSFYRPIMTTMFAIVYSLFGAHAMGFHIVQLLLYLACAFTLYLFTKSFFKPIIALALSLIFLIHPINSQVVYAIPSMQEPLFFLFGLLALLQLSRSQATKDLFITSGLLLISLLSKETGIVFICLALLYMFLFHRNRAWSLLKILALPITIYALLRINALGLIQQPLHAAPISHLGLGERLLTIPSIIAFYIYKFLAPISLATSYYWISPQIDFFGVIVPLIVDTACIGALIFAGGEIRRRRNKKIFAQFLFFSLWSVIGLLPYIQLIPLDMTACETWLLAALPGILGMLTIIASSFLRKVRLEWLLIIFALLFIILGVRTALRGLDYKDQYILASKDIAVSQDNYLAMNNLAQSLIHMNKLDEARAYAEKSVHAYPAITNYTNLGAIKQRQDDFKGAKDDYERALQYGSLSSTYENLSMVCLFTNSLGDGIKYTKTALQSYPKDSKLWIYLALLQMKNGAKVDAKTSITQAAAYGPVPSSIYNAIAYQVPLDVPIPHSNTVIYIP